MIHTARNLYKTRVGGILLKVPVGLIKFLKYRVIPDKIFIKYNFQKRVGYDLNLKNPRSFNEKLQWLKFNYKNPFMTVCADKYAVREYVRDKIGEEYLIPLIKIYEDFSEVKFDELPDSFALKATHGSGWNIICRNKKDIEFKNVQKVLKKWQNTNYYSLGKEWAYKKIPPRFLCEELILDENNKSPMDYKFFCFNGVPKFIQVDIDRFETHKRLFYDVRWSKQAFGLLYDIPDFDLDSPPNLPLMIELAKKLAEDFPFVRVDFYNLNGKIFFGELTFYPENGTGIFIPQQWDRKFGDFLKLPIE